MFSRSFAAALIVITCTAAASGSYLAMRQNAAEAAEAPAGPAIDTALVPAEVPASVSTESAPVEVVTSAAPVEVPKAMRPALPRRRPPTPAGGRAVPVTKSVAIESTAVVPAAIESAETAPAAPSPAATEAAVPVAEAEAPSAETAPAPAARPGYFEIVVPSSAVIGLEIENTITSEQARVEDRVDARVTRDVYADGRLAIPAGSKVIGAVTAVERGGKLKDRARLGVRFHTLVLAGGHQIPMRTEAIYRDGDSPGAESTRKIGGAAIGGAVLGAILGGGKGAVAGAGVGAAGGTAAVMAGGRNPATLAGGSVVTVRLSAPITVEVER